MFFSDVIFPAFSAPYFACWFFPVAALLSMWAEVLVFRLGNQKLTWMRTCAGVAAANLASWCCGFALSFLLPHGLISAPYHPPGGETQYTVEPGKLFGIYLVLGFIVAYILSILIEVRVWRRFTRTDPLTNCLKTTIWANTASYLVLLGGAVLYALA
jgi:hypothetical protein